MKGLVYMGIVLYGIIMITFLILGISIGEAQFVVKIVLWKLVIISIIILITRIK